MTARTRVDQDHLIAQLEGHDDKPQGRLIVGKTGTTQHGLIARNSGFLIDSQISSYNASNVSGRTLNAKILQRE